MDKITVVCHKEHVVGYEDYQDQCLLCVVEDLMREIGRLTAVCKEKEWVGLTDEDIDLYALDIGVTANKAPPWLVTYVRGIEAKLKEKNT